MRCAHDCFHGIQTRYDRRNGVLVYDWVCEGCGQRLEEATREDYRPSYNPRGDERFRRLGGLEPADTVALDLSDAPGVREQVDVPEHL
jgi:hypothetical protein